jgi:hypothetical protein
MHDELCPMQNEDAETCEICRLMRMVRLDEQDKFSGDEEWDRQAVAEEAYAKGFAEGSKKAEKTQPKVEGISLATINNYIMNGVAQRNIKETEALYKLYVFLGGK